MKSEIPAPVIHSWEEAEWDDPLSSLSSEQHANRALVERARASGTKRKKIVRGEAGFFMNRSVMTADFRVPPHSHDHDELLVVITGGCDFDGVGRMGPGDSVTIHAGTEYGFTCGPDGMDFLTIRRGEASVDLTNA